MSNFTTPWLDPLTYRLSNRFFNWLGRCLLPEWDRRLLGLSRLPIQTIIDIGANEGQFAKKIKKHFPQAMIYAFEPLPVPFQQLSRWAQSYPDQVIPFNLALGETTTTIEMKSHLYFNPSSSVLATTALCETIYPMVKKQEKIRLAQSTLDQVMQGHDLRPDILIKLDVQGYEDRVLRGGMATLQRAKACIIEVSLDPLYEAQAQFRDIFVLLDGLGYVYAGNLDQMLARDGHVRYFNAVFINSRL
ncbi:FkbM family methyltransferase [Synechocystis sp. LKSZ1]|uniref:FkbM family methyltransferase n=1 Tax=Synechocystis sp. LKSZ1 TaxID=3144951 RepID=UPI00336C2684